MTTTLDDDVNDVIKSLSKFVNKKPSSEFEDKRKKRMQELANQFLEKLDDVVVNKEIK
jgi:outer membrane protein assembly factor BamD (BamD/ComL family)